MFLYIGMFVTLRIGRRDRGFPNSSLFFQVYRGRSRVKSLLTQPLSLLKHPQVETLHLSLWPLSGNKVYRQAFLNEQLIFQLRPSETPLALLTFPSCVLL